MIDLGNIILRNWQKKDIKSLAKNANNKKIWNNLKDEFPYPYTEMAAKQWIVIANQDKPLTNFAIIYKGTAVGGIGIIVQTDVFRRNAEIGYWLGEKYWNKGISTLALNAMVQYAFETFEINRLFANVFESNIASIRVLKKCGFTEEVCLKKSVIKNNQIQDCFIYSIHRSDNS
ncbi:GNAT family N-acetyltransferase [Bacteroidota bacterium]